MIKASLTCDICARSYPHFEDVRPPGTACACGDTHVVCVWCIRLLDLPWEGRCPVAPEVLAAAALMRDEEDPEAAALREMRERGLL